MQYHFIVEMVRHLGRDKLTMGIAVVLGMFLSAWIIDLLIRRSDRQMKDREYRAD